GAPSAGAGQARTGPDLASRRGPRRRRGHYAKLPGAMSSGDPVRTTCPYCGVGCGVLAFGDGTISGDPEHPANRGRLCSKGAALGETLADEGRLTRPRIGGRDAGWDEALTLIADSFARTIARDGPDA